VSEGEKDGMAQKLALEAFSYSSNSPSAPMVQEPYLNSLHNIKLEVIKSLISVIGNKMRDANHRIQQVKNILYCGPKVYNVEQLFQEEAPVYIPENDLLKILKAFKDKIGRKRDRANQDRRGDLAQIRNSDTKLGKRSLHISTGI
jgi:hypothetical protein